jgi:hypothetical protein
MTASADEHLAALHVMQKLLQHHIFETRRVSEMTAASIEEGVIARKTAAQGPKVLGTVMAQVYSQNYEDAIIAEIFKRIGTTNKKFVEIGVENGVECNTRLLLEQGWRGLWIEGSEAHCAQIRQRFKREIDDGRLVLEHAFVTRESIPQVLATAGFAEAIDFFSVDVDMNTHHIWRAAPLRARVACIEYNASYPPQVSFEAPYKPDAMWDGTNWFGASLKALETIGREKAMHLVGCDISGVNAFFVDAAAVGDKFVAPYDAETHFEPARYQVLKMRGHRRAP